MLGQHDGACCWVGRHVIKHHDGAPFGVHRHVKIIMTVRVLEETVM